MGTVWGGNRVRLGFLHKGGRRRKNRVKNEILRFSHDANGLITGDGTNSFTYDTSNAEGQVLQCSIGRNPIERAEPDKRERSVTDPE